MAEKENRCWPGYEPVPGKKQHSEGSCRPKPDSQSTPAQKKFKAKRRKQLDKWQAEHPGTRTSAAQHLHAPGTETKTGKKKTATKRTAAGTTKKKTTPAKKKPTKKKATSSTRKTKTKRS
jgi:hypothetical protein